MTRVTTQSLPTWVKTSGLWPLTRLKPGVPQNGIMQRPGTGRPQFWPGDGRLVWSVAKAYAAATLEEFPSAGDGPTRAARHASLIHSLLAGTVDETYWQPLTLNSLLARTDYVHASPWPPGCCRGDPQNVYTYYSLPGDPPTQYDHPPGTAITHEPPYAASWDYRTDIQHTWTVPRLAVGIPPPAIVLGTAAIRIQSDARPPWWLWMLGSSVRWWNIYEYSNPLALRLNQWVEWRRSRWLSPPPVGGVFDETWTRPIMIWPTWGWDQPGRYGQRHPVWRANNAQRLSIPIGTPWAKTAFAGDATHVQIDLAVTLSAWQVKQGA